MLHQVVGKDLGDAARKEAEAIDFLPFKVNWLVSVPRSSNIIDGSAVQCRYFSFVPCIQTVIVTFGLQVTSQFHFQIAASCAKLMQTSHTSVA